MAESFKCVSVCELRKTEKDITMKCFIKFCKGQFKAKIEFTPFFEQGLSLKL